MIQLLLYLYISIRLLLLLLLLTIIIFSLQKNATAKVEDNAHANKDLANVNNLG